jgi:anti-anti-sigma factor
MVVRLVGEAGIRQVGELTAALLPLSARRPRLLILDLSGLTQLSCLAVGVLADFCRGILRNGCRVCLADTLNDSVREALVRTELLALFDLPDEADDCPPPPPAFAGDVLPNTHTTEVHP